MANNKNLSKLWKTEDWLAVWIGFIVIAIGCVAVLTGAFDFSALTFKTWTWGENLTDAQMAGLEGKVLFEKWEKLPDGRTVTRFATSWATTPEQIRQLDVIL